jgi:hypothetical protein
MDRLEEHNLGEMAGVAPDEVGSPKVEAMARALERAGGPGTTVDRVPLSVTRVAALHAARACDFLVTCVDNDGARLAAALIASLFCRVHLDIGTGVHGHGAERRMGADVRLLLPGTCVLCVGGLADPEPARRVLLSVEAEEAFHGGRDWRLERAGSLASLNQLAAAIGLRLIEDLVGEHLRTSAWVHVEFTPQGRLEVRQSEGEPWGRPSCAVCSLAGAGEDALGRVPALLRRPLTPSGAPREVARPGAP